MRDYRHVVLSALALVALVPLVPFMAMLCVTFMLTILQMLFGIPPQDGFMWVWNQWWPWAARR